MQRARRRQLTSRGGFSIAELVIIVITFAILATITINAGIEYAIVARDGERASDVKAIADGLERYYRLQASSTGVTYPPTSFGAANFDQIVLEPDSLTAPGQTTNSIVFASSTAAQTPTTNQYVYQPFQANGSLCTTAPCTRYTLYYRSERSDTTVTLQSMRQQ